MRRAANDADGAGGEGEVIDGGDHADGDTGALDFLGDRCTATIAGASRGHQETAVNPAVDKVLGDAAAQVATDMATGVATPGSA